MSKKSVPIHPQSVLYNPDVQRIFSLRVQVMYGIQRGTLETIWNTLDQNGDNILTKEELIVALSDSLKPQELDILYHVLDVNQDHIITKDDFNLVDQESNVYMLRSFSKDAFESLEKSLKFGSLLSKTTRYIRPRIQAEELDDLFDHLDKDHNQKITKEELRQLLNERNVPTEVATKIMNEWFNTRKYQSKDTIVLSQNPSHWTFIDRGKTFFGL